jgi:putative Holliday junction resolvase
MRIIGVDYGIKRIGLAIWDSQSNLALPRDILEGLTVQEAATKITDIADYEKADRIVVGMPIKMSGESGGEQVEATDKFVSVLRAETEVPVDTEDERLSSRMAERLATQAGRPHAPAIDAQAAALFLESYVQRHGLDKDKSNGASDSVPEQPAGATGQPSDAPEQPANEPEEG